MEDFIYEKPNALNRKECADVIEYFETMRKQGLVINRQAMGDGLAHHKKDESIFLLEPDTLRLEKTAPTSVMLIEKIKDAYAEYVNEYSLLNQSAPHGIYSVKLQSTEPGGGFMSWHYENDGRLASNRFVVFSIYLNDVSEGGETEFLYQRKRFKPEQGKLLLWPAAFTHTHRGNPPLNEVKYIATGWIEYFE